MAHTLSAKKRVRQTEARTTRNRARTSRIKTFMKKVEVAVAKGDATAAAAAFREAQPEIARGVTKGVLHRNTAARRISRLAHLVKDLAAQAA
ncbi:MAG TPA: 30S ribosomal protein S20 [Geminicoccus sp.]|uniref:30S ribosomal protein S20 n=1 Tax=Geminicoccus sp. TaxID=2024832 RepID=UPI002E362A3E|nr:30S ribosomal protein S20 [Geminicoccus sp.]HEX2529203.1 30S ribosomal protein S20 [Geminicoccus sp.]